MPQQQINLPRDTTMQSIVSQLQAIASALNISWDSIVNKPDNIAFYDNALAEETVAPIDPYLQGSDVVDDFTHSDTDKPLSANCGKLLNSTLAGFVHSKFVSGTTDSSGRLFPNYSIADKVVVGLLPDEHGKIAQQFRLSSNKLGIRVLNSDAMTVYANSNIGVNVFYISVDYIQTDDSN